MPHEAVPEIPEVDYLEATNSYMGWCPRCADFTKDSCEPDAHGRKCPECGYLDVVGAENALIMGLFTFKEAE